MIQWFLDLIDRIARDVSPELDECESCREPRCTQAQAATCQRRIDAIACARKPD
jgi:hypothetical protein